MKLFPKIIIGLAILLVSSLWPLDLLAAQQVSENQKTAVLLEQAPLEAVLSEIIPLSTDLSARLAALESSLQDLLDLVPIDKEISATGRKIEEALIQLQSLKDSGEGNYVRYLSLKQRLVSVKELLNQTGKPVVAAIQRLDLWDREWMAESQRWQGWQSSLLKDRSPDQLQSSFSNAFLTINKAQIVIAQHLEPLLAIQTKGAEVTAKINIFTLEVNKLIAETRLDSLFSMSPPMYSPLYFSQFRSELWRSAWGGLRLLTWPDERFFDRHRLFIGLLLLLFTVTSVVVRRNQEALKKSELWGFVAQNPLATSLFISTLVTAVQLNMFEAPATIMLVNGLIGGIACVRLLASVIEHPWKIHAAYGVIGGYLFTLLLITSGMPSPLFRLYIFIASLAGFRFCLKWLKVSSENVKERRYARLLRLVALLCVVIMIVELLGKAGVALYLFKSSLMTMAILLPVLLFVYLIRGALHWVFFSSPVWQVKLLRNDAAKHTNKTIFIIESVILIFIILPAILTAWDLFDSVPKAISGLLSPGFTIGDLRISVGLVIAAIGTLYCTLFASQLFPKVLLDEHFVGRTIERGVRLSVGRLLQYLIIFVGTLVFFSMFGLDITKLTIILSAFGVGIGFGLQSIVNNFVSGLILLFERPLREGDTIVVGTQGAQIKRIGLRATIVQTFENASVIIPNADLISNQVTNWTLNTRQVRLSVPVGVAYGTDATLVGETLLACARDNGVVVKSPAPQVLFMNLGESSLDFELRVWVPDADDRIQVKSELYHEIVKRFSEAKIEIPFPQRDLHLHRDDELVVTSALPKFGDEYTS